MKTRNITNLSMGLSLLALLFVGGGIQPEVGNAEPALTNAPPVAVVPDADTHLTASPEVTTSTAPRTEFVLPPTILPNTPLAEVIKLAQSGVGDSVMLAFVTNSIKPFDLGAEEIVYLNDLGVSSSVITSMMQHDQALKQVVASAPPSAPPPAAPEPEPVASAPSYVQPPPASAAEAPVQNVSNNYFYNTLAPYGNWIEVEGYGRCWQPTVVVGNPNWQPYCDQGRWVYSDAGWYWISDYTWGATAFHYGRWFSHPTWGWCWWPDTVWAPSWVNWRYSGAYCGWAPLPPAACYQVGVGFSYYGSSVGIGFGFGLGASCYTFVPWGGFCGARPYQYRVTGAQVTQIYHNTTVINNYGNGNNNTVINRGIAPDRVRQYSRTEVRTVKLREQGVGGPRNEQLEPDGRTLAVYRPKPSTLSASREALGRIPVRSGLPITSEQVVARSPQNPVTPLVTRNGNSTAGIERIRPDGNVVTQPTPSPVVTIAPTMPAPKVYQSRVVQGNSLNPARPATAAPAGSLVVIGGKNTTRSGGRDYSVWTTPSPAPVSSVPGYSPRIGNPSPTASSPGVRTPTVAETTPAPIGRVPAEREVASREAYPTFSTSSPRAPSYTPRPVPGGAAQNFTPPSQPTFQNRPQNSQRVESRPTPSPVGPPITPPQPTASPGSAPAPRSR